MGIECKKYFKVCTQSNCCSVGLLLLRVVAGIAFMYHGWGKIQNPFAWMPPESPVPGIFQFLAALSEFGGGLAWILGFLMPLASLGLMFTMLFATYFHMIVLQHPFVGMNGGPSYELAAIYLVISILFLTTGPGKYSVDAKIFGGKA